MTWTDNSHTLGQVRKCKHTDMQTLDTSKHIISVLTLQTTVYVFVQRWLSSFYVQVFNLAPNLHNFHELFMGFMKYESFQ